MTDSQRLSSSSSLDEKRSMERLSKDEEHKLKATKNLELCRSIMPHLIVNDCEKAIQFYKTAFKAQEISRNEHNITLKLGLSSIVISSSSVTGKSASQLGGAGMAICMWSPNVDETTKLAVNAGATILQPAKTQFWGDRMSVIMDPMSFTWYIFTQVEDITNEEIIKRASTMMGKPVADHPISPTKSHLQTKEQELKNLTLYLFIKNSVDAIKFYSEVLGFSEVYRIPHKEGLGFSEMYRAPHHEKRAGVFHAELKYGDTVIMLSEADEHHMKSPLSLGGCPVSIIMNVEGDENALDKLFQKLSKQEGINIIQNIQQQSSGVRSFTFVDKFGYKWNPLQCIKSSSSTSTTSSA